MAALRTPRGAAGSSMAEISGQETPGVSLRTCVVCGCKKERRLLLRLVAAGAGAVAWDRQRRAPGRGAWCCSTADCRQKLPRAAKRLARVLRQGGTVVSQDVFAGYEEP